MNIEQSALGRQSFAISALLHASLKISESAAVFSHFIQSCEALSKKFLNSSLLQTKVVFVDIPKSGATSNRTFLLQNNYFSNIPEREHLVTSC